MARKRVLAFARVLMGCVRNGFLYSERECLAFGTGSMGCVRNGFPKVHHRLRTDGERANAVVRVVTSRRPGKEGCGQPPIGIDRVCWLECRQSSLRSMHPGALPPSESRGGIPHQTVRAFGVPRVRQPPQPWCSPLDLRSAGDRSVDAQEGDTAPSILHRKN